MKKFTPHYCFLFDIKVNMYYNKLCKFLIDVHIILYYVHTQKERCGKF